MICYLDRTWCASLGCANACGRKLTDEVRAAAERWWGKPGAPIAVGYFCGAADLCRTNPYPPPTLSRNLSDSHES